MASVDFNREAFVPTGERVPRPPARMFGSIILVISLAGLISLGYKVLNVSGRGSPAADSQQAVEAMQQQLTKLEKRIDQLERRRKASASESDVATSQEATAFVEKASSKKTVYTVVPNSGTKTQSPPNLPTPQSSNVPAVPEPVNDAVADREVWQATTDRLADVVGVVGSQEGEIAETRQQLNALLARTGHTAIRFELRRGSSPQLIGPVSMVLKSSDAKSQRYTLCVYVGDKCVELRNRSVNEVVVFVVSRNSAPLELVATKILHDQIAGYLEIPKEKTTP